MAITPIIEDLGLAVTDTDREAARKRILTQSFQADPLPTTITPQEARFTRQAQKRIRTFEGKIRALGLEPPEEKTDEGIGRRLLGNVFDALEKLRAPQFALFNALRASIEGEDPISAFGRGLSVALPDAIREGIGVTEEKTTGKDLATLFGVSTEENIDIPVISSIFGPVSAAGIAGLFGDLIADPLIISSKLGVNARAFEALTQSRMARKIVSAPGIRGLLTRPTFKGTFDSTVVQALVAEGKDDVVRQLFDADTAAQILTGNFSRMSRAERANVVDAIQSLSKVYRDLGLTDNSNELIKLVETGFNPSTRAFQRVLLPEANLDDVREALIRMNEQAFQVGGVQKIGAQRELAEFIAAERRTFIQESVRAQEGFLRVQPRGFREAVSRKFRFKKRIGETREEVQRNIAESMDRTARFFEGDIPVGLEGLITLQNLDNEIIAANLIETFSFLSKKERGAGVLEGVLEGYFPRIPTERGFRELGQKRGLALFGPFAKGEQFFEQARTPLGRISTLEEMNDILMARSFDEEIFGKIAGAGSFEARKRIIAENAHRAREVGGEQLAEFFIKDPFLATQIRTLSGSRRVNAFQFMEEVEKFGSLRNAPHTPETYAQLDGLFTESKAARELLEDLDAFAVGSIEHVETLEKLDKLARFPNSTSLAQKAFSPEVNEYVNGWLNIVGNPDAVKEFMGVFSRTTDIYKSWTLGIFPAYHVRNAFSNQWQNFISGMRGDQIPLFAKRAFDVQAGKAGRLLLKDGTELSYDVLRREVLDQGVQGLGIYGAEIARGTDLKPLSFMRKLTTPSQENFALRAGFTVGRGIENNARVSHYLWRRVNGLAPEDASRSVAKWLFDYGDMSKVERALNLKRVLPFYTFTRKALPANLEALALSPTKFTALDKIADATAPDVVEAESLPAWIRESVPIKTRLNADGFPQYFLLANWLPAAEIEKIFAPIETTLEMLNPIFQKPLESFTGRSFFFKTDLPETSDFLGLRLNGQTVNVLRSVRVLNELDKFNRVLELPESVTRAVGLEGTLPFGGTAQAPFLTQAAQRLPEGIQTAFGHLGRATGVRLATERQKLFPEPSRPEQLQRFLTGFRVFPTDIPREQRSRIFQREEQLRRFFSRERQRLERKRSVTP